jgi:5-methyltetrahydropteroyltriglutamate--homocysteine methyltransferase
MLGELRGTARPRCATRRRSDDCSSGQRGWFCPALPFANGRHAHEYRIFKKAPLEDEQILVAGVIDTLSNVVEHLEVIADRIEKVATLIGDPRQVLADTDCGFDTPAGNSRVASDVAWAKLRALSEGASIASRRLFGV